jgi:hypothetical protein
LKREQSSRFSVHNGLGVFGDCAPKTWPVRAAENEAFGRNSDSVSYNDDDASKICHFPFAIFHLPFKALHLFFC